MYFHPIIAQIVADAMEKVCINPGNFDDVQKDFEEKVYKSEADYLSGRGYFTPCGEMPYTQQVREDW